MKKLSDEEIEGIKQRSCPFCKSKVQMNNGGYLEHISRLKRCPISTIEFPPSTWMMLAPDVVVPVVRGATIRIECTACGGRNFYHSPDCEYVVDDANKK